MPWSDQGGGGQGPWGGGGSGGGRGNSPWGRPGGGPNPKDIEEMLRRSQQRFRGMFPGGFGGSKMIGIGVAVLLAVWAASGFYRVQPSEQGIELVFGRFTGVPTDAGLHWNWPAPIGDVYLPNVTVENRIEIGFRSAGEVTARAVSGRDVPEESQMITGDENLVDIDFVVFWRISDAAKYLFTLRDPDQTVKVAAEAVMRDIIGGTRIQDALTDRRGPIESEAQVQLQRLIDDYGAGIEVRQVQLLAVDPPDQVIDSFNEVTRARQDLERLKNEAEAYRNDVVPRARGESAQIIEEADAYRQEVVNRAQGDANRFESVYQAYSQSKDVTTQRIYLETLEEVLKNVNKVIIDDSAAGSGVIPYLPLPEVQKRVNRPAAGTPRPQGGTQ